jgi:2-oxoglutarate/2-oxoacid ferredoxin oxidoreductase subunit alpha
MTRTYALTGNQVVVKAAIDAGCTFYAGYPISPSSEIAAGMAKELPKIPGASFIQMEDEIASMGAVIGASLTGKKVLTATSGPGFSLKQENLGFACMTEVPCVIVNVMRNGPSTGMPTYPTQGDLMQARWGTHGDHPIIVLIPSNHKELYEETIRAFNLAEKYRQPVVLLSDEILSQMNSRLEIPERENIEIIDRAHPDPSQDKTTYKPYDNSQLVPPLAPFFTGYRYHVTGLTHDEGGFPTESTVLADKLMTRLMGKISANVDDICKWVTVDTDDAETLLVSIGSAARSAEQVVNEARAQGQKLGLFKPLTLWPFPEKTLLDLAQNKRVIVVEMNLGQLSDEVERILHRPVDRVLKANGEMISPQDVFDVLNQNTPVATPV